MGDFFHRLADRDRGHRLRGVLRGPGRRPAVSGGIDPERLVEMAVPGGGPVDEPAAEGGHRRPAERAPAEPEQEQRPAEGRRGDALGLADVGFRRPSTRLPLGRGAESCPSSTGGSRNITFVDAMSSPPDGAPGTAPRSIGVKSVTSTRPLRAPGGSLRPRVTPAPGVHQRVSSTGPASIFTRNSAYGFSRRSLPSWNCFWRWSWLAVKYRWPSAASDSVSGHSSAGRGPASRTARRAPAAGWRCARSRSGRAGPCRRTPARRTRTAVAEVHRPSPRPVRRATSRRAGRRSRRGTGGGWPAGSSRGACRRGDGDPVGPHGHVLRRLARLPLHQRPALDDGQEFLSAFVDGWSCSRRRLLPVSRSTTMIPLGPLPDESVMYAPRPCPCGGRSGRR